MSDAAQGLRNLYKSIDSAGSSQLNISECEIMEIRTSDKKVRVELMPDGQDGGWVRLYMLGLNNDKSSGVMPSIGNTCLILFPRGQAECGIVLAGGMTEAGELGSTLESADDITLHDQHGNKITMTTTGISIVCDQLTINGGIKPVARIGDKVASPFGPLLIIEGNNNFLA